jgi:DNA-binding transcriptional LysR family regulator
LNINYFWTPLIGQCQDRFALCVIGIVMDLDWLKDFLALAEQKNFSRAADVRNVTQPAFSRRVRALEDWIGTPLFVRGAQGATLTPAGSYFRPLADDLMRSLHRARRDTRAVGERAGATLSIAATHALSFTFFPGWIRRHMRFEALGTLNLISDSMEACEQIMLGGEVHFLLCHYHAAAPTRFDPPGSRASRWATMCWSRSARWTRRTARSGRFQAHGRDRRGCSPTAKLPGLAGFWRHIKSVGMKLQVRKPSSRRISLRRC